MRAAQSLEERMNAIDVLLVAPTSDELLQSERAARIAPAYGVNVLATFMRLRGLRVYVLDEFMMMHHPSFAGKSWVEATSRIVDANEVNAVGVSVMTNFVSTAREILASIQGIPTFVGGAHITSIGPEAAGLFDCDLVLRGHIDAQMVEAVKALIRGDEDVPKIMTSCGDCPTCPPDYAQYQLYAPFKKITTRISAGCRSVGCSFCCAYQLDPRPFTYPNVEETLAALPISEGTSIEFHDSDFLSLVKPELVSLLESHFLYHPNVYCHARVESVTEKRLALLSSVGAQWKINIGLESASLELCKKMNKPRGKHALETLLRVLEANRFSNLAFGFFALVGIPGETRDDVEKTITYLKEIESVLGTIDVSASIVNVIPSSTYYRQMVSEGLIEENPWKNKNLPILTAVQGQALADAVTYWKMFTNAFPQSRKHNTIYASLLSSVRTDDGQCNDRSKKERWVR